MDRATISADYAAPPGRADPLGDQAGPGRQPATVPRPPGGTGGRLLRFALANITRRRERFVLSTAGIGLAVMAGKIVPPHLGGFASFRPRPLAGPLHGYPPSGGARARGRAGPRGR